MPFQPVQHPARAGVGGNFPQEMIELFNLGGANYFMGNVVFRDAARQQRIVPIFNDQCLDRYCDATYELLAHIRKQFALDRGRGSTFQVRSIHQNQNGYLPWRTDGDPENFLLAGPAIARTAGTFGALPHMQAARGVTSNGQFLEYTWMDDNVPTRLPSGRLLNMLQQHGRFIVDYRYGLIWATMGHYHPDSFCLAIRSWEIDHVKNLLPELDSGANAVRLNTAAAWSQAAHWQP